MKLINIFAIIFMCVQESLTSSFSLGNAIHHLVKRIEHSKFPLQTCDIMVMGNLIAELEISLEKPVTIFSSDIDSNLTLPSFETFLANHLKCLIVFASYTGKETIPFMNKLLEKKPNSLLVLVGSTKMVLDSIKRWKPMVYINLIGPIANVGNGILKHQQSISLETRCPDSTQFSFDVWNSDTGFSRSGSNPFVNCKHPFEGRFFMISATPLPPTLLFAIGKPLSGADVAIMKILSEKFKFKFGWKFTTSWGRNVTKNIFTAGSAVGDLINGGALLAAGVPMSFVFLPYVDYTIPYYIFHVVFATRNRRPLSSNNNMLQAFDPLVWGVSYISLLSVSATFGLIYYVYLHKLPDRKELVKPIVAAIEWADFIILPFSRLLEPEPLTWFPLRFSAGQMLIQFWSVFTLFLLFFYTSNLQADLVRKTYEKPLNTLQDVVDRDQAVYIPTSFAGVDYKEAEAQGFPLSDIMVKISKMAYKTSNGYYDINELLKNQGKFLQCIMKDVENNGAVVMFVDAMLPYMPVSDKSFVPSDLQYTKEILILTLQGLYLKKYSPWKEDLNRVLSKMVDTGITQKLLSDPIPIRAKIKWNPEKEQNIKEPLRMNQLMLAFYIMAAMYLITTLIFFLELLMGVRIWNVY